MPCPDGAENQCFYRVLILRCDVRDFKNVLLAAVFSCSSPEGELLGTNEASKASKASKSARNNSTTPTPQGQVRWGTPPHVAVLSATAPLPRPGLAAMWGKNQNLLFSLAFPIGLTREGTGKTLVGLYQGTAKSPWVHYGPRPPYCGDAPSSHGRPS